MAKYKKKKKKKKKKRCDYISLLAYVLEIGQEKAKHNM